MPNWCSNQATIHGTKKQILELVGAYERGGVIENYLPTPRDPDDPTKLLGEDKTFGTMDDNSPETSWYYWRLANWGTKVGFWKDAIHSRRGMRLASGRGRLWLGSLAI